MQETAGTDALPSQWKEPDNRMPTRHCSILQCAGTVRLSKTRKPSGTGKWNYTHYVQWISAEVTEAVLSPST